MALLFYKCFAQFASASLPFSLAAAVLPWVILLGWPLADGISNMPGHVEPINQLCRNDTFVFRWVGQNLYSEDDFTVRRKEPKQACNKSGEQVDNVFCAIAPVALHLPHVVEVLHICWYFFEKYPNSSWFVLYANLSEPLAWMFEALNINMVPAIPNDPCTNDIVVHQKPGTHKVGWHHDEGGPNFISIESASSYRHWWLELLQREFDKVMPKKHRTSNILQIGILNRRASRRFTNPEVAARGFYQHTHNFQILYLDDMADLRHNPETFLLRCRWVNQLDLLITPHGAQLTHLVCANPCTVIVEVYPERYFFPGFFLPPANALNLVSFGIYPGKDGYASTDNCSASPECRLEARSHPISLPNVFSELTPYLLNARQKCLNSLS